MIHHHDTTDAAIVDRDRRLWLAAAIRRERDGFGRSDTMKHMMAELFTLKRDAANAGWIAAADRTIPARRPGIRAG